MSAVATLYAENTPTPPSPYPEPTSKVLKAKSKTVFVASVANRIPVFWLFCFEEDNVVDVSFEGERFSTVVSDLASVRERLAARDSLAKQWFPEHARLWDRWREVIDSLHRKFLKVDAYPISDCYESDDEWGGSLVNVLDCIAHENEYPFDALNMLLGMAGIGNYDPKTHSFRPARNEPEWCLVGGNVEIEIWPGGGKPRGAGKLPQPGSATKNKKPGGKAAGKRNQSGNGPKKEKKRRN